MFYDIPKRVAGFLRSALILTIAFAALLAACAICVVGSIIALMIIAIVDLSLLVRSGLLTAKYLITDSKINNARESLYRKENVGIEITTRMRYKHTSLFLLMPNVFFYANNMLGDDFIKSDWGIRCIILSMAVIVLPISILGRALFLAVDGLTPLQATFLYSQYEVLTYRDGKSEVIIHIGCGIDSMPYIKLMSPDLIDLPYDSALIEDMYRYSYLVENCYLVDGSKYSSIITDILESTMTSAAREQLTKGLPTDTSGTERIIDADQKLIESITNRINSLREKKTYITAAMSTEPHASPSKHL